MKNLRGIDLVSICISIFALAQITSFFIEAPERKSRREYYETQIDYFKKRNYRDSIQFNLDTSRNFSNGQLMWDTTFIIPKLDTINIYEGDPITKPDANKPIAHVLSEAEADSIIKAGLYSWGLGYSKQCCCY